MQIGLHHPRICSINWLKQRVLRPPADVVLEICPGPAGQEDLDAVDLAVVCCPMQRSPTSAAAWSSTTPRPSFGAQPTGVLASMSAWLARRNSVIAVWPPAAATCSAVLPSLFFASTVFGSHRTKCRTAGRSPFLAAWKMSWPRHRRRAALAAPLTTPTEVQTFLGCSFIGCSFLPESCSFIE